MTPQQAALLLHHLPDPSRFSQGEAALMPSLLRWLVARGRLRSQTRVAHELPWMGRRVDLALVTGRPVTSAFELKIGRLQRVIEQAAYNGASFNRSWVVTGNQPKDDGLGWAKYAGVGLLVIQNGAVTMLASPTLSHPPAATVARLRRAIVSRGDLLA
jgi:hypothetical protein